MPRVKRSANSYRASQTYTTGERSTVLSQLTRQSLGYMKSIWAVVSARRPVRITVGLVLLLIGIAGLFLPILQGLATIVAALAILRKDIPMAERVWQRWVIPMHQRWQQWRTAAQARKAARRR